MERDPFGGSDARRDTDADIGDEPSPALRDAAPDYLAPLEEGGPSSGHTPGPEPSVSAMDSPEHDWERARDLIYPAFRPVGSVTRIRMPGHAVSISTLAMISRGSVTDVPPQPFPGVAM